MLFSYRYFMEPQPLNRMGHPTWDIFMVLRDLLCNLVEVVRAYETIKRKIHDPLKGIGSDATRLKRKNYHPRIPDKSYGSKKYKSAWVELDCQFCRCPFMARVYFKRKFCSCKCSMRSRYSKK